MNERCDTCSGPTMLIGQLSNTRWWRCRNCGQYRSHEYKSGRKAAKPPVYIQETERLLVERKQRKEA